jgi:hypothetical protein
MRKIAIRKSIVVLFALLVIPLYLAISRFAGAAAPNPGHTWTEMGDVAVTVSQGGTGQSSLTLNNVILGNGASAVSFVAPGTTGNVLMSDGSTWASSALSYPKDISYYRRTGSSAPEIWYSSPSTGTALTATAIVANTLYAMPFVVPKSITLDRISIRVTSLSSGNARLGIYADGGNIYPGSLVLDAGIVSTGSTGVKTITISQALTPGMYWLVLVGSSTPTIRCFAIAGMIPMLGLDNGMGTAPGLYYSVAFSYAALPASYPGSATIGTATPIPAIYVRLSV